MKGIDKYKENGKASQSTFFYLYIEYEILKEIRKNKAIKRFSDFNKISMNAKVLNGNEKSLESILLDERAVIDIITQCEDDIIKKYYDEIVDNLKGQQQDFLIRNLLYEEDVEEIAVATGIEINNVRKTINRAKNNLIKRSMFIQSKKRDVLDAYISYYNISAETVALKKIGRSH